MPAKVPEWQDDEGRGRLTRREEPTGDLGFITFCLPLSRSSWDPVPLRFLQKQMLSKEANTSGHLEVILGNTSREGRAGRVGTVAWPDSGAQ